MQRSTLRERSLLVAAARKLLRTCAGCPGPDCIPVLSPPQDLDGTAHMMLQTSPPGAKATETMHRKMFHDSMTKPQKMTTAAPEHTQMVWSVSILVWQWLLV